MTAVRNGVDPQISTHKSPGRGEIWAPPAVVWIALRAAFNTVGHWQSRVVATHGRRAVLQSSALALHHPSELISRLLWCPDPIRQSVASAGGCAPPPHTRCSRAS